MRDGHIVEVGSVQELDCPLFDAGGLTVMPMPIEPLNMEEAAERGLVEHLFRTSYPRYPASYLYFQEEPYLGFNLAQIAHTRGKFRKKLLMNYRKNCRQ